MIARSLRSQIGPASQRFRRDQANLEKGAELGLRLRSAPPQEIGSVPDPYAEEETARQRAEKPVSFSLRYPPAPPLETQAVTISEVVIAEARSEASQPPSQSTEEPTSNSQPTGVKEEVVEDAQRGKKTDSTQPPTENNQQSSKALFGLIFGIATFAGGSIVGHFTDVIKSEPVKNLTAFGSDVGLVFCGALAAAISLSTPNDGEGSHYIHHNIN